jgi:hypothetical protein
VNPNNIAIACWKAKMKIEDALAGVTRIYFGSWL